MLGWQTAMAAQVQENQGKCVFEAAKKVGSTHCNLLTGTI
jgi:hypothetical protein